MAILTAERPLRGPARRLNTWTMTREALTIGFDAGDGFLGRLRGSDITRFRCGGRRYVSLSHPDYVDHVLHEARLKYVKSNEYAHLLGGNLYEPKEENPMIGFRGASRYRSPDFAEAFALECQALKKVRDEIGLTNVWVMIPFVRTVGEAKQVVKILQSHGLERGVNGLKLIMMCEVPSNAILAEQFLELFDGFSIGSNDLTQLTLALDRDSGLVAELFDEQNEAVKFLLSRAIQTAKHMNKYIGICGQGPSDHPELADWLVKQGIESMSLNPDSVLETWLYLAEKQKELAQRLSENLI